jgi:hypothetical protein
MYIGRTQRSALAVCEVLTYHLGTCTLGIIFQVETSEARANKKKDKDKVTLQAAVSFSG